MPRHPPSLTPRSVRDIVADGLTELLRDQPMSQQKLEFAWRASVGPALARVSTVALDGSTLRVELPGPLWAVEMERAALQVVERLTRLLGPAVVSALEVRPPAGTVPPRRRRRRRT